MREKKGFILIESCVYIAISVVLIITVMSWVTQTIYHAGCVMERADKTMATFLVHDILLRDLQSASSTRAAWHKIESSFIMWERSDGTSVSWNIENGQLVRKEGVYHSLAQQWGKYHKSIVAYGVASMHCAPEMDGNEIKKITISLCLEGSVPITGSLRIRNRKVT